MKKLVAITKVKHNGTMYEPGDTLNMEGMDKKTIESLFDAVAIKVDDGGTDTEDDEKAKSNAEAKEKADAEAKTKADEEAKAKAEADAKAKPTSQVKPGAADGKGNTK